MYVGLLLVVNFCCDLWSPCRNILCSYCTGYTVRGLYAGRVYMYCSPRKLCTGSMRVQTASYSVSVSPYEKSASMRNYNSRLLLLASGREGEREGGREGGGRARKTYHVLVTEHAVQGCTCTCRFHFYSNCSCLLINL